MKETRSKNTELGPIPVDWEIVEIGSLGKIITTSCSPYLYPDALFNEYSMPAYDNGQIVDRVKGREINSNRYILNGEMLLINKLNVRQKRIWTINVKDNESVCSTEFLPFQSEVMPIDLLRHILLQNKIVQEWSDNSTGTSNSQKRISPKYLKEYRILVPGNHEEQERIAEALSDVDALIAELGELIEKKRLVKQGAMQQLLTASRRLPGFSKPWVEKRLGDVCDINRGGSPRPIEDYITSNPNGINWIKIGDTSSESKYITKTAEKIKPEGARFSRMVKAGDFILSNSMSFGRPYILAIDGCIHDGWLVIQNYESEYNVDFLYYILSSDVVFDQYISAAAGSSVKNLNKEKVADVIIYAPSDIAEQRAIAEILTDMDNEIAELEAKREKYQAIKEGMMQQLLTGRIRLIDSTASSGTIDPSASINSDGDTPAAHTPPITYEPSTSYPQSLAAEPTILE